MVGSVGLGSNGDSDRYDSMGGIHKEAGVGNPDGRSYQLSSGGTRSQGAIRGSQTALQC